MPIIATESIYADDILETAPSKREHFLSHPNAAYFRFPTALLLESEAALLADHSYHPSCPAASKCAGSYRAVAQHISHRPETAARKAYNQPGPQQIQAKVY